MINFKINSAIDTVQYAISKSGELFECKEKTNLSGFPFHSFDMKHQKTFQPTIGHF